MKTLFSLLSILLLVAGCATTPPPRPAMSHAALAVMPSDCGPDNNTPAVPGGLGIIRSVDREVLLVALRGCVMTVDAQTGGRELLPTHGDAIAPTMLDVTGNGIAFSSSLSGTVRAIDPEGAIRFNVSGLLAPRGIRLLPSGAVLVAEAGAGQILHLGPGPDSRPRLVAEGLGAPFGVVVADATQIYVSDSEGGRILRVRLDRSEQQLVLDGLQQPQGLTLMNDGRLAVIETGRQRLLAVDVYSGVTEVLAVDLPMGEDGADDPHAVADVTAAPDGRLFFSTGKDRNILIATPRQATAKDSP